MDFGDEGKMDFRICKICGPIVGNETLLRSITMFPWTKSIPRNILGYLPHTDL